MFRLDIQNRLLLTGAGFTKNFGGYLASEMWAQIFNTSSGRESNTLRQILRGNQNFESVYSKVLDDPASTPDDRDRIKAVFAFSRFDARQPMKTPRFSSELAR